MVRRANNWDIKAGQRLRLIRLHRGEHLRDVGKVLDGRSYQQVQNYEHGDDRISAGLLKVAADHFKVPTDWFFSDEAPPP
jgi:transcriptional regulator with XRE-family HTH domain